MARRSVAKNARAGCADETARSESARQALLSDEGPSGIDQQLGKLVSAPLAPGLYIVSTPIGNLGDISLRALHTLAAADWVFCEDTRHSRKLFSAYGIGRRLDAYHDFSSERDRQRILNALGEGKTVAIISDAGTPLIADPGFKLVRAAIESGHKVFAIPGPSALLAALVSSGFPSDQFFFGGFLPPKDAAKRKNLEALRAVPGTLIFYETAARIEATLLALDSIFGERDIALARELTKLHEAFAWGRAKSLLEQVRQAPLLGEIVILVTPGETPKAEDEDLENALRQAMRRISLRESVEEVAKGFGASRKKVYNLALKIRGEPS